MVSPRVLVIDDDRSIRGLLLTLGRNSGLLIDEAADGVQGIDLLGRHSYDLVILDLAMPHVNGFDIMDRLPQGSRATKVIVLTALPPSGITGLDPATVLCVVRKPFDVELLKSIMIGTATEISRWRQERFGRAGLTGRPEVRP